jgi:hypothetical protein
VFQRGNLDALLTSVRQLRDELLGRGWHLVHDRCQTRALQRAS